MARMRAQSIKYTIFPKEPGAPLLLMRLPMGQLATTFSRQL